MTIEELKRPERLDEDRIEALKALFPEAFLDGRFNAQTLKELLESPAESPVEGGEFYGLTWPGKKQARKVAAMPSRLTLKQLEVVGHKDSPNLMVLGDNLEVIRILQKAYNKSVKLIYIDPPYNTGSDFIYRDDYSIDLNEYLEETGQADAAGRLVTNLRSDGRFHSRWLSMMYARLFAARELLREDGTILVSINDVEFANLKLIMDEIFGEENFITSFIWNNEGNIDQQSKIKVNHEFIMMYSFDAENLKRPAAIDPNIEETSKIFNDAIENTIIKNGPANPPSRITIPAGFPTDFKEGTIKAKQAGYPLIYSDVTVKDYKVTSEFEIESGWSSKNLLSLFINNQFSDIQDSEGKVTTFYLRQTGAIYMRKVRSENQGHVLSVLRNFGTSKQSSNLLKEWGLNFSFPKPIYLIQYLCQVLTSKDSGDIIMDFFAGSGTTAHAVIKQNKSDGGNRQFICVQIPDAYSFEDEEGVLSDITVKRIRLSIEKDGKPEDGFRTFRTAPSNIRKWNHREVDLQNLGNTLFTTVLNENYKTYDVLTELMLLEGFPLDSRVEQSPEFDDVVHVVTHPERSYRLLVCLSTDTLSDTTVEEAAKFPKDTFVCLESSLNDQLKLRLADAVENVKTL
ncbi:site-specific DNA-methyltransferase [Deinococcus metallilatus]|uniref:Adenine-specific DNA-methyltransferase n=1 Tax=Deinococcus metallilatus TaxID=1211322 RepID=A0AAJ5F1V9_9DEIO|nr:site-specific DNA-methyltransferase [Deinococcus metallilatus]MBB5297187.1 adenine-specific DNA-methyltransferase [Deinococcus metallilatus]RXJ17327.1 site-specific DNA-methyltransferase [Deinococcus metallilatus]TLK21796.1 site-specific DNA-methyltransferase [Deinococcus metallilatus]GMA17247.1 adenine methyltransferase [Deinococcus metallilatus]